MQPAIVRSLSQHLLQARLLVRGESVVVGVSGGADSMALLYLLLALNRDEGWGLVLHLAHLNHRLRADDSEKDAAFVQAAGDHLSLPCAIEACDVAVMAEHEKLGMEEVARRERYSFFSRVAKQSGAKKVVVGHHADDQAETILHRIVRGTGLRGLAGMSRSRPLHSGLDIRLVRPLLNFTRAELRAYLVNEGVAFREDRTNRGNEPMRNRIRNLVIPLLEAQVNPQVREALTRMGEQAQWLQDFLHETVVPTFEALIVNRTDQSLELNAETLSRKSRIVQTELIRTAYRSFGLGEQELTFAHIISVLDLLADSASGKQTQLPSGMTVEKRYGRLLFCFPTDEPREALAPEVQLHLPGVTHLPMRKLEIECDVVEVSTTNITDLKRQGCNMHETVDFDAVRPPLVVRGRRRGERFFPLGAPGSKKVSDFLTDAKVAQNDRDRIVVLCDQLGPIWIVGHRIDDRVKLTSMTKRALHITARPLATA